MSLINEMRNSIVEACRAHGEATLVDIVARFDWRQHAIPTLNEFRQAMKGLDSLRLSRGAEGLIVVSTIPQDPIEIEDVSKEDMQMAYDLYLKKIKVR